MFNFTFEHLVEFPQDNCIFAAGREADTNKTRIYLIFNHDGRVYTRNGRANSWEDLSGDDALEIHRKAQRAKQDGIPYYVCNSRFSLSAS